MTTSLLILVFVFEILAATDFVDEALLVFLETLLEEDTDADVDVDKDVLLLLDETLVTIVRAVDVVVILALDERLEADARDETLGVG